MLRLKHRIMATACLAIAGTAGLSGAAQAYAAGDIFSGGAALPAPDFRQRADCYALPTQLITKGAPPTFQTIAPFNYVGGSASQDCSTTHIVNDRTIYYMSATSGTGILSVFSHDPTLYGFIDAAQTKYFPSVQFALSETPLSATDVGIWNSGGTETQGSSSVVVVPPNGTPLSGQYGNPLQHYGPPVQFPISVDPLLISYDSTYKKVLVGDSVTSYHFNIRYPRTDDSGGLRLDPTTYCKILNGQITDWNDPALKTANGNRSLEDPADPTPARQWSVPLQIVGRGDSAGATAILTRHLAAACASLISGNQYSDGTSTLPSGLRGPAYSSSNPNYPGVSGETPGKYTLATGMAGVAKYVAFTATPGGSNPNTIIQGRVGYLSTDYVLPAVLLSGANTYNLQSATLKNSSGNWIASSTNAAIAAFASLKPPQSDSLGHYDPSNTSWGSRSNPQDWVQSISHTALLANPTAAKAYPILGTANFVGYTCYASAQQWKTIIGLFNYGNAKIMIDTKNGILGASGMAPLPNYWRIAIGETFIKNSSGLGLAIARKGTAGACAQPGITGG